MDGTSSSWRNPAPASKVAATSAQNVQANPSPKLSKSFSSTPSMSTSQPATASTSQPSLSQQTSPPPKKAQRSRAAGASEALNPPKPSNWKIWLKDAGLDASVIDNYAQVFQENEVFTTQASDFSDDFLARLGISKGGHRLLILQHANITPTKILKEIEELKDKLKKQQKKIQRLEEELKKPTKPKESRSNGSIASSSANTAASPKPLDAVFDGLKLPSKTTSLMQLVFDDTAVAIAIMDKAPSNETDQLASSIVSVFANHNMTKLILASLEAEINNTVNLRTLFRQNNVHTKVLSAHAKMVGNYYLKQGLGLHVTMLIADSNPAGAAMPQKNSNLGAYEVDPNRLLPLPNDTDFKEKEKEVEKDIINNQENLIQLVRQFVECVKLSADIVPLSFREICRLLKEKVADKNTDMPLIAVIGSFMFLRFICPAIIDPVGYGVVHNQPPPAVQRTLLLVAKTLQNLANGTKFNEPYMQFMNPVLADCTPALQQFCEQVSIVPPGGSRDNSRVVAIPKAMIEQSINTIVRIATSKADKIGAALISYNQFESSKNFLTLAKAP